MIQNSINGINDIENPVTTQNFASSTKGILDMFRESNLDIDNFKVTAPTQIQADNSLIVSIFLYNILENPLVKKHSISVFSEPDNEYSYSENVLQYILTVHSNDHLYAINAIEKLLGVVYSTPSIQIPHDVKQLHLRVNLKENPIEVWDRLFPSTPYRLSFLLTVHGPGITYRTPQLAPHHSITMYDSTEEPEELFSE